MSQEANRGNTASVRGSRIKIHRSVPVGEMPGRGFDLFPELPS